MRSSPTSPRRQRKAFYTAGTFERRRRMTVPLSRDLRSRFRARSIPIRKGDTVRVLSGSFVGREERVAKVIRRDYAVVLDNVTLKTGEDKLKPLPIRTSHLVITRLNLSDPWRRRVLKVSDAEVTPEELGVSPEGEETTEPATDATPAGPTTTAEDGAPAASAKPKRAPKKETAATDADDDEEDAA
ncbi:MAG TPA: 50S ribosomal protein L24 [Thermoplasmata archaeon]|nr:50S ribosomal protein L24 [Thermoplasmata archaeon]